MLRNGEYMNFNDLKKIESIECVYGIYNRISKKWYIGSTIDLHDRMQRHRYNLLHNTHHSKKLQNSVNKYGIDKFEISILEICNNLPNDELANREKEYIDLFNSYKEGYNSTDITRDYQKFKLSEEAIEKVRKRNMKAVICLTTDGKFVKEYQSLTEAAEDLHDQTTNISQACKSRKLTVKGFLFVYKDEYDPNEHYTLIKHVMTEDHKQKIIEKAKHNKRNRKVFELDSNNQVIKVYYSARSLEQELNLRPDSLRSFYNKSKEASKFQIQDRIFEIEKSYYLYKDIV